jgi:Short C-terminal domain
MFGIGAKPGSATVVAVRLTAKDYDGATSQSYSNKEYMVDVVPDDGTPPFRATAEDPYNSITFRQPEVGDVVRVKFHGGKVHFDRDDPNLHRDTPRQAAKKELAADRSAEARQAWDALHRQGPQHVGPHPSQPYPAQPYPVQPYPVQPYPVESYPVQPYPAQSYPAQPDPGASQSGPVPPAQLSGIADLLSGAADLAAATASLSEFTETLAAIKRARAAGDVTEVARLKAEFAAHSATHIVPSTADTADPIDRLERLAALHAQGVLTDAEFAQQKAKILNED